jgi:signal transduction histidine kinase
MTKPRSLAFRLIVSSAVVSVVLLLAAAILLNSLFQQAIERNFDARLRAVLDGLTANVELAGAGVPVLSSPLADTRFDLPLSGWYWQVTPPGGNLEASLASGSLLEKRLTLPANMSAPDADGAETFYLTDANGNSLRGIKQTLELFGKKGYSFVVTGNFDELRNEVKAFRRLLYFILALLGLGLLAAMFVQVKFGLKPMQDMEQNLNDIRSGKAARLDGNFPKEIQPVADELNLLMSSNAEVLDRARTQVGNLAHALKTPLSVLTNEAAPGDTPLAVKVTEQVGVMRDQVNLYLDRARRAAAASTLGTVCEIEPVIQGLARTLQRINRDRHIHIEVGPMAGIRFRGERQDLEEMAGNLLDNACKWAKATVGVKAHVEQQEGRPRLIVEFEDDGPGIPAEKRQLAVKRGLRLDETKPGSGLGLHIVSETAAMYGGKLTLADATSGGLRTILNLPAI